MSIFSKVRDGLKQGKEGQESKPRRPAEPKQTDKDHMNEDLSNIDISSIDIPLDQELTEHHGVAGMIDQSDSIDIDLAGEFEDVTGMPPNNVLHINPSRSFSHPLDLNLEHLERSGFISPTNANTPLSNAFRMIKRPLLNNAMGKGASEVDRANTILITSSLSSEGKSYMAINLALSIAMEKNKHILLIDADVNKPSHHKLFGVESEFGLTDLLSGKVDDMSKVLYRTNIPSLSLMFAGTMTSHATELLASEAMERFVEDISARYPDRIIIFDSPPLLLTTESSALAAHMGQVVLVVEAEKTLKHQAKRSLSLLHNEIVMLLLNKMRENNDAGDYGFYGYGYGQQP
jgi:exopolysaccharide/PEP-CTERM locus tyrosine autokinase